MTDTRETTEITIVLHRNFAEQLARVAREEGRAQEVVAGDAVTEWLEDLTDIAEAERVLAEGNPSIPAEEVWKRLGLED